MRLASFLPALGFLVTIAFAAIGSQPSPDGCVDPAGLTKCVEKENTDFVSCGTQCNTTTTRNKQDCLMGCGLFRDAAYLGCQVQSCWNKVYSCDYQKWALLFIENADLVANTAIIPFYPAPEGAAGACCERISCGLVR